MFRANILARIVISIFFIATFLAAESRLYRSVVSVNVTTFIATLTGKLRVDVNYLDTSFFCLAFDFCLQVEVRPFLDRKSVV